MEQTLTLKNVLFWRDVDVPSQNHPNAFQWILVGWWDRWQPRLYAQGEQARARFSSFSRLYVGNVGAWRHRETTPWGGRGNGEWPTTNLRKKKNRNKKWWPQVPALLCGRPPPAFLESVQNDPLEIDESEKSENLLAPRKRASLDNN